MTLSNKGRLSATLALGLALGSGLFLFVLVAMSGSASLAPASAPTAAPDETWTGDLAISAIGSLGTIPGGITLIFGVQPGATDGFDQAFDSLAPPPPFSPPFIEPHFFYSGNPRNPIDLRKLQLSMIPDTSDRPEWPLRVEFEDVEFETADVTIVWDLTGIPSIYDVELLDSAGTTVLADMRVASQYQFQMEADDRDSDRINLKVRVTRPLPETKAVITNLPAVADEGQPVRFTGDQSTSASGDLTYLWTFGDGNGSTADNVTHTYEDNGTLVTLIVTDAAGASDTATADINISNVPPVITDVTAAPIVVQEGNNSRITVIATDVTGDLPDLRYRFDCDDNGAFEIGPQAPNTADCPFPTASPHRVVVEVNDGDGGVTTGSVTVTVLGLPTAVIAPTSGDEGIPIVFDASASTPGGTGSLSYDWNFGDGNILVTSDAVVTHVYADDSSDLGGGVYGVTLFIFESGGTGDFANRNIVVRNVDPFITDATATPSTIPEGTSTTITVVATDPGSGDIPDLLYSFDCDNSGNFEKGPQTGNAAICFFPDNSVHPVPVKVVDQDGGEATSTADVTVNNVPPAFIGNQITAEPASGDESLTSTITAFATDVPADIADLRYSFDCSGDGFYEVLPQTGNSTSCDFQDGDATVTVLVKVTDDTDETTGDIAVFVGNVAPAINNVAANPAQLPSIGGTSRITVDATDVPADVPDLL